MPLDGSTLAGEIRFWANRQDMPKGLSNTAMWLPCDGKSYKTNDYPYLFLAIGHRFGGSGGTFNVPDMRGRACMGAGNVSNTVHYAVGQKGGEASYTMTMETMPAHNHTMDFDDPQGVSVMVSRDEATSDLPIENGHLAAGFFQKALTIARVNAYREFPAPGNLRRLNSLFLTAEGSLHPAGVPNPEPMENRQPFVSFGYYIYAMETGT